MKLLVVLGSGGHTAQMLKLVDLLGEKFEYAYLVASGDSLSAGKIRKRGEVFFAHRPKDHGDNPLIIFFKVIRLLCESLCVLRMARPDAVVSAGPGLAVPVSLLGKAAGKKVIFLESWSRVYRASSSGKIMYRFADLFFIQWPELARVYPRAIYAGRLP